MADKSKLQLDLEVVFAALSKMQETDGTPESEIEKLDAKFLETKQEAVKLAIALKCFFIKDLDGDRQQRFGKYLKSRLRPAMSQLIEKEELDKIDTLNQLGWIEQGNIDGMIQIAREQGKLSALTYFMQLKNRKFTFSDKDFSL